MVRVVPGGVDGVVVCTLCLLLVDNGAEVGGAGVVEKPIDRLVQGCCNHGCKHLC
jgi:hypothetical protein